jgi:surfeit locus 1 family protein
MRVSFRPLPVFSLVSLLMLAALIGLGTWQLDRLAWKEALIAQVNRNLTLPPLPLDQAMALGKQAEYRRVALSGRFDHAKETYVYGLVDGVPVYHVLTPLILDDGRALMIDRGIVPNDKRDPATRRAGQPQGPVRVVGIWRASVLPGLFTPKPDIARRQWFSRDVASIAAADHVRLAAPVLVEADATPNPGRWPEGGHSVVTFRNEHLQYAVTWYALATALIGIYVVFHVQKARLGFTRRRGDAENSL